VKYIPEARLPYVGTQAIKYIALRQIYNRNEVGVYIS
jgi:hypothetical protein